MDTNTTAHSKLWCCTECFQKFSLLEELNAHTNVHKYLGTEITLPMHPSSPMKSPRSTGPTQEAVDIKFPLEAEQNRNTINTTDVYYPSIETSSVFNFDMKAEPSESRTNNLDKCKNFDNLQSHQTPTTLIKVENFRNIQDKSQRRYTIENDTTRTTRQSSEHIENKLNANLLDHIKSRFARYQADLASVVHVKKEVNGQYLRPLSSNDNSCDGSVSQQTSCLLLCDLCEREFTDSRLFEEHKEEVHTCIVDGGRFRNYDALYLHLRYKHTVGVEKFKPTCNLCKNKFASLENLKKHELVKHKSPQYKKVLKPTKPKLREYNSLCDICGAILSDNSKLVSHYRRHTGEKPFSCDYCEKRFATKELQRNHHLIHTGEKPFSCQYCSERFNRYTNFANHVKRHTGERPFICQVCNKGFITKQARNSHQKICTVTEESHSDS